MQVPQTEIQTGAFNIPNLSAGDALELVLYVENFSAIKYYSS